MIAGAEAKIAKMEPEAANAAERVEIARSRLEKLRRGEDVSGGLGKRPDIVAIFKAAGWTPAMFRRARLLNSLTKAEFETLLEKTGSQHIKAGDKLTEREARRIIGARTS